ncbi:MAG: hypothetical protein JXB88_26540 [Spirochaetales bacterium]|nr:hypothetical protein [Spirochaetales bacterium]
MNSGTINKRIKGISISFRRRVQYPCPARRQVWSMTAEILHNEGNRRLKL